jgi:hypothetical protein
MSRTPLRSAAAALVAALAVSVGLPAATAAPAALPDPGGAAMDWIVAELAADGGHLTTSFDDGAGGVGTVPDYGLTIDAALALEADGQGGTSSAADAAAFVEDNLDSYITGVDFGAADDRYAGPIAKAMLMALVRGDDPAAFGGWDLDTTLRDLLQESGVDAGRFSDVSAFGDFSNGFGQALAIMALDRTSAGVPAAAVEFLLDQQCPGGAFRGNYSTPGGCTADADATVDATGMALMALTQLTPTCATRQAVTYAVGALLAGQNSSGAFGGESGSNTNSTGLAAGALRSLGEDTAADDAAAFITSLQLESGDDLGAFALNAVGFASAADGVQVLERDSFRRATTQAALAFDLPSYAELGLGAVDPAAFAPCDDPPVIEDPSGSLSVDSIVAGGTLTVQGVGFQPGETVRATLMSVPVVLGEGTADAEGVTSFSVTIPADIEPGDHTVELRGLTSGVVVQLPLEVRAAAAGAGLPVTGSASAPLAAAGIGLLALGAVALAASRRRVAHIEPTER